MDTWNGYDYEVVTKLVMTGAMWEYPFPIAGRGFSHFRCCSFLLSPADVARCEGDQA